MLSLAYQAADVAARALPGRLAEAIARALAGLAFALHVPARAALESNLARLLPAVSEAERRAHARASFEHFALSFLDFLRVPPDAVAAGVEVVGGEHLDAARASGRGVILLSAHVGSWERGAAWLSAAGLRVRLAARSQPGPRIERLFAERRAAFGVGVLRRPPLFGSASSALRRGEWVALMGDRAPKGSGSACGWAATLARRTGAVLLPVIMVRRGRRGHVLRFEAPISAEACGRDGYRSVMRDWLARYPDQWAAFEPLAEGVT